MINATQHEKLWELIKKMDVAMMSTVDKGMIRSRPMRLVQNEYSGKIWLFVNPLSAKVTEIDQGNAVNLSFMDTKNSIFVSLSGLAKLVYNHDLICQLWQPEVAAWFPSGPDDEKLALLEVEVDFAEYWDSNSGKMMQFLENALAQVNDRTPNVGEHVQIS